MAEAVADARWFGIGMGTIEPTPEEQAQIQRGIAHRKQHEQRLTEWAALIATTTDPVACAVLEVHTASEYWNCEHCEDERWPCPTVAAAAGALGLPDPPDYWATVGP